ncbi:MAG: hypothetical protein RDU76_11450 [Candidatus Edwardsbacteria bacterium]|nr:hypothetical protein [Candidatus Edwardsbacteria bacterium]
MSKPVFGTAVRKTVDPRLSAPEKKIIAILRQARQENSRVNVKSLMRQLGTSDHQVRFYVQSMQDKGAPVCTTAHGVELAETAEQMAAQFERMQQHAIGELARAYKIKGSRLTERSFGQIRAKMERAMEPAEIRA